MPSDPTRSKTKRDRFQRLLHRRWRDLRGDVREAFEDDSHFRPQNDVDTATQVADFREFFEDRLDDRVVESTSQRNVRNGAHYTAPRVREFYEHGIREANRSLEAAGYDVGDASPEAIARADHHQETLQQEYLETYQDIEDAARAAEEEATREYRTGVREGAAVGAVLALVNDRADKTGRHRTDLVAQARSIGTINDAALERYSEAGVEQVTAQVETDGGITLGDEEVPDDHEFEKAVQTAGDTRVCATCQSIAAAGPYTLEEIRNDSSLVPPYHPRCRCILQAVPIN